MQQRPQRQVFLAVVVVVCVALRFVVAQETTADALYKSTRCNEASSSDACRAYERCKATHRCGRGDEDYDITFASLKSFDRLFVGGERHEIPLVNDFEDWKTGTHRWKMNQHWNASTLLGFTTWDFLLLGSLELSAGYLVFDTTKARLFGDINVQGVLKRTRYGTEVAVFNFMTVYLGKDVKVRFQGSNAICILSRSSAIIDTPLVVRPGTLGGFAGGGFVGTGNYNNNQNGPGSPNVRVYVKTVSTFATHVSEIQEIQTSCAPGQKLQGHFLLSYEDLSHLTQPIPFDATSYDVQRYLETAFGHIGSIHVERSDTQEQNPEIGRTWRVTFVSAVGDVPQLVAISRLTGLDSKVQTRTIQQGNQLSGTFQLTFRNLQTRNIAYDATSDTVRQVLLNDFPMLLDARVARTDEFGFCEQGSTLPDQTATNSVGNPPPNLAFNPTEWLVPNAKLVEAESFKSFQDKLCSAGRGAAGGVVWKIQFWTRDGNIVPTSPSSPLFSTSSSCDPFSVTAKLSGTGARAEVINSLCFSLSFGGAGGSHGNFGGSGYGSTNTTGLMYSSALITDLVGGSGGAGGGLQPIDVFPVVQPTLGGAGGGALMLSAVNDILIGPKGAISVNGGTGNDGFTAGGGGSGGSIFLSSGATISHQGLLQSLGGDGGKSLVSPFSGGAGSGGRISILAQAFSTWGQGTIDLRGGTSQHGDQNGGQGSVYTETSTSLQIRVDPSMGAAGTFKSLLVDGSESYEIGSAGFVHSPSHQQARNGPFFELNAPSRPSRVSYFVRVGNLREGRMATNRGALFAIHDRSLPIDANDQERTFKNEMMIAIAITEGFFVHEANVFDFPRHQFQRKVQQNRWYKIDLLIDWFTKTYSIQLNDIVKVSNAKFVGESIHGVSLNNYHAMSTWWDELYVGNNHLVGFVCPSFGAPLGPNGETLVSNAFLSEGTGLSVPARKRKLWKDSVQGLQATSFHPMQQHESHLSRQEKFQYSQAGQVPFDGEPHRDYFNDVREQEVESDASLGQARDFLYESELLRLTDVAQDNSIVWPLETGIDLETLDESANMTKLLANSQALQHRGSIYWFSEFFNDQVNNTQISSNNSGIGSCSTTDYLEWKNEGVVLHFANLTDPFGNHGGQQPGGSSLLFGDYPKVIYNTNTAKFVMWMHVDDFSNTMGLSGVATSDYPNGPFTFQKSFYPDAPLEAPGGKSINETHDQTVAFVANSPTPTAYLIRTFYKTVEYWLPRSVMDPLWQSIHNPDGTTNFGLNYHRAFYDENYDDPNDIAKQRWRMEDNPWEVICCEETQLDKCVTVTTAPSDGFLNYTDPVTKQNVTVQVPDSGSPCPNFMVKKGILGQAQNDTRIATRYKDPNDQANNAFIEDSVPSHTTWGFPVYNVKTWRGNYYDSLSTNISQFVFKRYAGRSKRLAIEKSALSTEGALNAYKAHTELEHNESFDLHYDVHDEPDFVSPDFLHPFTYPNEEESESFINVNDTDAVEDMLSTLGVPLTASFTNKYASYDIAELDIDGNHKVSLYEVALLQQHYAQGLLSEALATSLLQDFEALKAEQISILDANGDGKIMYPEFRAWLGEDPGLLFDQFDLDKNGFLDENELARCLWDRQIPRIDMVLIFLDPSFDGRVYFPRFMMAVQETGPQYVFSQYDFDGSGDLTRDELELMAWDLKSFYNFTNFPRVQGILQTNFTRIPKQQFVDFLISETSLISDERQQLTVDNAVHGTRPDSLVGPMQVVETRRAKYAAISRLTSDFLSTEGLLQEIEGDFEGREALIHFFGFEQQLFGLSDASTATVGVGPSPGTSASSSSTSPFRLFLSPNMLHERASFWNGRHWEGRPSAPVVFTYGEQCQNIAGTTKGCLPCQSRSSYVTDRVDLYQSFQTSLAHCDNQKELDAYVKDFDQQVSIQMRYQQRSSYGYQGLQPHYSPCFNQSEYFPCDVHQVLDGTVADGTRNFSLRNTLRNLAWENHPNNRGSSQKIRADELQEASIGPSFVERFPNRQRDAIDSLLNSTLVNGPDQLTSVVGGGS